MEICIIGTGYVGLVTGACLANVGNIIYCVDKDERKVDSLRSGKITIFEPSLEEIVKRNISEERLFFTTSLEDVLNEAEICFVTVDTPPENDGSADLSNIISVAEDIGRVLNKKKLVVTKSTVPVGTTFKIKDIIKEGLRKRGIDVGLVSVASNPEFLKEGDAVNDFLKPARIIVGVEDDSAAVLLHNLYHPFMLKRDRLIKMSIASAELTKYAANAMLATRISFMNELSRLCEKVGADIDDIRRGIGSDPRIGPDFLYAGLGYGGSCFPKDIRALIQLGKEYGCGLPIIEGTRDVNESQRDWFWQKVRKYYNDKLNGKIVSIWGLSFKPNTDDVRESPALYLIDRLLCEGAKVRCYDYAAMRRVEEIYGGKVGYSKDMYDCINGSDGLIIATEWDEFRSPDFKRISEIMRDPVIFDGRRIINKLNVDDYAALSNKRIRIIF